MTNKLQKGFIFRQENCVGCGGCAVACQIHNELPEDVRFRKVDLYEGYRCYCAFLKGAKPVD